MSLAEVRITRQLPVINGFVELPNNLEPYKTRVLLADFLSSFVGELTQLPHTSGMGRNGGRHGPQQWVEFEHFNDCCPPDPVVELAKTAFDTNQPTDDRDYPVFTAAEFRLLFYRDR
jgi:hypothetical protein